MIGGPTSSEGALEHPLHPPPFVDIFWPTLSRRLEVLEEKVVHSHFTPPKHGAYIYAVRWTDLDGGVGADLNKLALIV